MTMKFKSSTRGKLIATIALLAILSTAFYYRQPASISIVHPEWQSPDPELENRLKDNVVDIVNNYPNRNGPGNSEILEKLANRIEDIFNAAGGRTIRQEVKWEHSMYHVKNNRYSNVIASYGPEDGPRIVVGAHYDAVVNSPGADDNASGVAVLLELAKMLGKNPPNIRVDLAAYTLEEYGLIGSAAHAKSLKAENVDVKAMISLEMLGYYSDEPNSQNYPHDSLKLLYPSKGNFICVAGKTGDGELIKKIKNAMAGATPLPVETFIAPASMEFLISTVSRSDHSSFWTHGYTAVMLTDTSEFRNSNYHKKTDVPETLDYRRMAMVTAGLEKTITLIR